MFERSSIARGTPLPAHPRHPPTTSRAYVLQRAIGNHGATRLLQRSVAIDGTPYPRQAYTALLAQLTADGIAIGPLGSLLFKWVSDAEPRDFKTSKELYDALVKTSDVGRQIQDRGDLLEQEAARVIGGEVAEGGKFGGDPELHSAARPHQHVKLDVLRRRDRTKGIDPANLEVVGIVGGGAKAKNLGKFKTICIELRAICDEFQLRPVVFASETTPQQVIDTALPIVGAGNVYVRMPPGQWVIYAPAPAAAPAPAVAPPAAPAPAPPPAPAAAPAPSPMAATSSSYFPPPGQ